MIIYHFVWIFSLAFCCPTSDAAVLKSTVAHLPFPLSPAQQQNIKGSAVISAVGQTPELLHSGSSATENCELCSELKWVFNSVIQLQP